MRTARVEAGLSIRDLALAAGVAASTILRIEEGRVDPTVGMWEKIMTAAGQTVVVTTRSTRSRPLTRLADLRGIWRGTPEGGEPDWTRLRAFIDRLRLQPADTVVALRRRPPRSESPVLDALLAGIAEKVAADAGVPAPLWTKTIPALPFEWSPPGGADSIGAWRVRTPPSLRRRRLVVDEETLWRSRGTIGV